MPPKTKALTLEEQKSANLTRELAAVSEKLTLVYKDLHVAYDTTGRLQLKLNQALSDLAEANAKIVSLRAQLEHAQKEPERLRAQCDFASPAPRYPQRPPIE